MKYNILFFISIFFVLASFGQNEDFNNQWRVVQEQENKGQPKSALQKVEDIERLAKKENNGAQQIKVLLYKSKYALTLEEDAQLKIIKDFKDQISASNAPSTNVLEGYLANLYWQYFQQNRYKFYDRTQTSNKVDSTDFRTWDLKTLFNEIDLRFSNSLLNANLLQKTPISNYSDILDEQKDSEQFRPTLFDLLAHNALKFYKSDENSITQPAYKFSITDERFLSTAENFANMNITARDSSSLQLKALKIYQELISFHLKSNNEVALVDVDIDRLLFVLSKAVINNKESLLKNTLKESSNKYKGEAVSGIYDLELANLLWQQGQRYNPKGNQEERWRIKEALEICQSVINAFPQSVGAQKCERLKNEILTPSINITSEHLVPVDKPSKILLRYKNLQNLNLKIYRVSTNQLRTYNTTYRQEEKFKFVQRLKPSKEENNILIDENDYQFHTTEVLIPKLGNGHYLILAETDGDPKTYALQSIQVSDFALVEKEETEQHIFQIINRINGRPIADAEIAFSYQTNGNQSYSNKKFRTDKKGQFSIPRSSEVYNNIKILATKDNHSAYFEDLYIHRTYNSVNEEHSKYSGFLFTDRSIYRPGQTLYLKGIAIKTISKLTSVIENEKVIVSLYDVNNQMVKELELITNDYGSVSGEFMIPNSGLTGEYRLELDGESKDIFAEHYLSVEEYKRPKFKAEFLPVNETYKLNDTVSVNGEAIGYSGTSIGNAKVIYRVFRKVEFPRWFYWSRPWFNSEPQEIVNGETLTDEKGLFKIDFIALPDTIIDKENLPIFHYEISAEITDINGETRSTTTIVNVGYHALMANILMDDILIKEKNNHPINIETTNLNGEFIPTNGTLKIYKLIAPEYVLRNRPWENPDYKSMTKEEFKKLFPYEAYDHKDDSNTWEKGELVFSETFNTGTAKIKELENISEWVSGMYVLELETTDKFGQLVKDEKRFSLVSEKPKKIADNQLFEIRTDKKTYETDDNVILSLGTAAEKLYVTLDVEKNHKIVETFIVELNDEIKTLKIPIDINNLGGFAILYSYAFQNEYKASAINISVPYPKTELEIETTTFRDKIKPGTDETWEFKIKGPRGEKVAAELLASMYDLSLDQFKGHEWEFNPIRKEQYYSHNSRRAYRSFGTQNFMIIYNQREFSQIEPQNYSEFNWFGLSFWGGRDAFMIRGVASSLKVQNEEMDVMAPSSVMNQGGPTDELEEMVVTGYSSTDEIPTKEKDFENISIRKNLQETAFFFPKLRTDESGNISFSFTTPEALTSWKLQLLAHTKSLESKMTTLETITQKELMVIPNVPRFLRQGDQIVISSKISNLTDNILTGTADLVITDALNGKEINQKLLGDTNSNKDFSVDANGNSQVSWSLSIPDDLQAIQYKIVATTGEFSDGEQSALPVLSNRTLVTETLPLWVRGNETRTFTLDKLKSHTSSTLRNHQLTLEMTSNPAWYAVQALPYLMEYPYDCNEQIFARVYANSLASFIANSNPRIKEVFDQWASQNVLISNLEKNQELKSMLIEETPWLRDAQSESEQKKRIGLLFNINKLSNELQGSIAKLKTNQLNDGSWAWFKGGNSNRYITQHIIAGFGHLNKLTNSNGSHDISKDSEMVEKAIRYLDSEFIKEYKDITKYDKNVDLNKDHLSYSQIHYLYMRSFYPKVSKTKEIDAIQSYYLGQIKKYWLPKNLYAKAMMAIVANRMNDINTANTILTSLEENSITNDELGMYWKENSSSWLWFEAPVETQALMIEAFSEIKNDTIIVDNLKVWLLKNKQTNSWKTTKATTEATYALLLQGTDWLSNTEMVSIELGGKLIEPSKLEDVKIEAGTGYFKTNWNGNAIESQMADVTLTKNDDNITWGGLYWQYFEDLDKTTSAETPLKLSKKLFKRTYSDTGELLNEIIPTTVLNVGDLVRVRIELKVDRAMEFIHMKDMRATGLEPTNVLSEYKWRDGLGYYESTKDASTNFFFDYLPKGVYVFEYDLRVNNAGNMSNGITTIESMYAPEFSSHSEGVRINVSK